MRIINNAINTIKYEWYMDHTILNELILRGKSMRMGFTEKEFIQYRNDAMGWLSQTCEKVGDCELSNEFLAKSVDAINLDGNIAHLGNNRNQDDLYSLRKIQLEGILQVLGHFHLSNNLFWTNLRSWLAIIISILTFIIKCH